MSDLQDLRTLFSIFPDNISLEGLKSLEHFRRNQSHMYSYYSVSHGILALLIFLYGTISLVAIVGNALVIFVVIRKRIMQTITNVFIANLAFADVAIGIFTIPFQFQAALSQRWEFATFMCKVAPFVKNLSVNVSILTLTVIAFDRYVAVMYPLRAGIRKRVAISVLCVIWLISIIGSVPEAAYYDTIHVFDPEIWSKKVECTPKWPSEVFVTCYFSLLFILQYVLPLLAISFSYIRIAYRIWESKAPGHTIKNLDQGRNTRKKKVIKMLIIVVSLFAVCWLPLQVYNFSSAILPAVNKYKYINIIWLASNWLAMSNSCYNPFIYGLLNEKFKREFKSILKACSCPIRRTVRRNFQHENCDSNQQNSSLRSDSRKPLTKTHDVFELECTNRSSQFRSTKI